MPDHCFFLSYASADRVQDGRNLIRAFFTDLDAAIKGRGYRDGGFLDEDRLEGKWKPELQLGLASSRILVPLYSPNYFLGPYCGKEWQTFNLRFDENENHRYRDVTESKVILPVLWGVPPLVFPKKVKEYQFDYDVEYRGYPPEYRKYGLAHVVKFKRHTQAYGRFVQDFAIRLAALAGTQGGAKVRDVMDFDKLIPPFPGDYGPGLRFVRYVFVAGMKYEMTGLHVNNDGYSDFVDRSDWKPCYPHLGDEAKDIATAPAQAKDMEPELLKPSPELIESLQVARLLNNVIVVMVDPWSVKLPDLHEFLLALDKEPFPNSAVLVNWNRNDPELPAKKASLEKDLEKYFRGRRGRKEFYRDPVESPESIAQAVEDAFNAVRTRLIEMGKIPAAGGEGSSASAPVIRN